MAYLKKLKKLRGVCVCVCVCAGAYVYVCLFSVLKNSTQAQEWLKKLH